MKSPDWIAAEGDSLNFVAALVAEPHITVATVDGAELDEVLASCAIFEMEGA